MQLDEQVQALLAPPPAQAQRERLAKLTQGLGLEVRQDAGAGKGRGVFATQAFEAEQLLFTDPPLAAIQHTDNRPAAWVCAHCFRFLGSVEHQMAHQIRATRAAAAAEQVASGAAPPDAGGGDDGSSSGGDSIAREAALALPEAQLRALEGGALRLPHTDAVPLPAPVACPGGCEQAEYCSAACAGAAWQAYHQLLCPGPQPGSGASSSGKAAAAAPPPEAAAERRRRAALREFLSHADETNDVLRLAAVVVAQTLLAAERLLQSSGGDGGGSSSGASSGGGAEPGAAACWAALQAAWLPYAMGHKALWWDALSLPPEAASDMRELAADSLELLAQALPPALARRYPALLALPVWGSIMGMFELNNLSVYVASPIQRWLNALEALPEGAQSAAYAAAGLFLDALPEEMPGCDGNAFYALHSCCNHSCAPNAEAFKRDKDEDGRAVILALRPIAAGEEVMLSYVDEEAPLAERREGLEDYGFACACAKCEAEELAEQLGVL